MVHNYTSLDGVNIQNTWLTIGSFDGVHTGHQQLIRELKQHAHQAGAKSVVLTFHPHPTVVLKGRTGAFYLTTVPEKVKLLDELKSKRANFATPTYTNAGIDKRGGMIS